MSPERKGGRRKAEEKTFHESSSLIVKLQKGREERKRGKG